MKYKEKKQKEKRKKIRLEGQNPTLTLKVWSLIDCSSLSLSLFFENLTAAVKELSFCAAV
jgi:hypothetical protein